MIDDEKYLFQRFGYKDDTKKYTVSVECLKCKQIFTKTWSDFFKNQECYFCENKQKMNTISFKKLLPKEYTLLSEYTNTETKILIKHYCGFTWKTIPKRLKNYYGCPKCNKRKSKGERKIEAFLLSKKITYLMEHSFLWQTNKLRRYDFYLPEYNLIIEYMGEQHYKENSLFKISLAEQKRIDKEKKTDALNNDFDYLEICYKDFLNIDNILLKKIGSTTTM